jgi:hypothetical protein
MDYVVGSYTPSRVITTHATSSARAYGTGSGTTYSPYGSLFSNTSSSANAYGTSATSTYIPSQTTYVPITYEVPITQQKYLFWATPRVFLNNWLNNYKHLPIEQAKQNAALYAQAWGVPLPKNLQPKETPPQRSEKFLAEVRKTQASALNQIIKD